MQHFEVADNSPVHKISSQSNGTAGSDTDINAIDDDANVLNLSRRRSSDNTICNNNNSNNNNNNLNNNKTKNGSTTPPRITYVSSFRIAIAQRCSASSDFSNPSNISLSTLASIDKYSTK